MKENQKKLISEFVKNGRMARGLTQKELSDLTNISIRSIQRIENAELVPRSYTLKTLASALGISFDSLNIPEKEENSPQPGRKINNIQKIILSVGISLVVIFLGIAFILQSPKFPETGFEAILFWAIIIGLLTLALSLLWKPRS